ncbi:hypothetical protein [Actinopolymorpha singaporensis]|uniref:hypothetical protein n=1 Tax=Actinopolymorpha singaporensis TaxID=117157 RepID=UPI000B855F7B|nr:hypothetical protein [Actinopolymorpha singaporensis]
MPVAAGDSAVPVDDSADLPCLVEEHVERGAVGMHKIVTGEFVRSVAAGFADPVEHPPGPGVVVDEEVMPRVLEGAALQPQLLCGYIGTGGERVGEVFVHGQHASTTAALATFGGVAGKAFLQDQHLPVAVVERDRFLSWNPVGPSCAGIPALRRSAASAPVAHWSW